MSYHQILFHIIFRTKDHLPCLIEKDRGELFRYFWGIVKNKNCTLYRINGVEDHLHILSDLHPCLTLSDYIKTIKVSSSVWIKSKGVFPDFCGWAEGYGAFTYKYGDREKIILYIKNQKEYHKKISFMEEYESFLKEFEIVYDKKYL